MDYQKIGVALERKLGQDLYRLVEGPTLERILINSQFSGTQSRFKHILAGHSFKLTPQLAPRLYNLAQAVLQALNFSEPVEFFVSNDAAINAYAIAGLEENQAHIVNLNSGLVELLDDDELKFVIGHEVGHLISRNAAVKRIIDFVFSKQKQIPLLLQHKIGLWDRLAELTADRYGFIASPNLQSCLSSFFALASGLNAKRVHLDYQAYLNENDKLVEFFKNERAANLMSHPVNPIRVKAINLFAKSALYNAIQQGQLVVIDDVLSKSMAELIDILLVVSGGELDMHRRNFIASAGLIMANLDRELAREEFEAIVKYLSAFTIFPKVFLQELIDTGKAEELFDVSVKAILAINPSERYSMFSYLAAIALSDQKLFANEVGTLYAIGQKILGFSNSECAALLAEAVQEQFMPRIYS